MLLYYTAQRPPRRASVQRSRHRRPAHIGHSGGRLPRVPRHGAVHHTRDPGEGTGTERRVRQHRLRHHGPLAPQVHGVGKFFFSDDLVIYEL